MSVSIVMLSGLMGGGQWGYSASVDLGLKHTGSQDVILSLTKICSHDQ